MAHKDLVSNDEVDSMHCTADTGVCEEAASTCSGDGNVNLDDRVGCSSIIEDESSDCRRCDRNELLSVSTKEVLNSSEHECLAFSTRIIDEEDTARLFWRIKCRSGTLGSFEQ